MVFPFGSSHPWGIVDLSGASVIIAAGEFEAGNGTSLATAQQPFTIAADSQYIGLSCDPTAGALALISPTTAKPVSGGGVFRTWLYFFQFDGTNAALVKHNLTGAWHGALFAATTA